MSKLEGHEVIQFVEKGIYIIKYGLLGLRYWASHFKEMNCHTLKLFFFCDGVYTVYVRPMLGSNYSGKIKEVDIFSCLESVLF